MGFLQKLVVADVKKVKVKFKKKFGDDSWAEAKCPFCGEINIMAGETSTCKHCIGWDDDGKHFLFDSVGDSRNIT